MGKRIVDQEAACYAQECLEVAESCSDRAVKERLGLMATEWMAVAVGEDEEEEEELAAEAITPVLPS